MNVYSKISDTGFSLGPAEGAHKASARSPEIAGVLSVLLHLIDQRGPIVVFLGAASHGEGTTTVARALAVAATSWSWCKVGLVDASSPPTTSDTRPTALSLLDISDETKDNAFHRPLWSSAPLMEAALLGAHPGVPRLDTVRTLFDELRKTFTLIIVDSPPILVSQEIAAFSAAADCVLLVVEAERTRVVDVERARTTLEQFGARIIGLVLNKRRYTTSRSLGRRV
jgi:cellulose biosynthesis protein BcsQ